MKTNNTDLEEDMKAAITMKDYGTAIKAYIEIWKSRLPKEAIRGLKNIIKLYKNKLYP